MSSRAMDDSYDHWQRPYAERAGEIAAELSGVVESLDELIVDNLRSAIENDVRSRPPLDKDLQSARRSIEKAIRHLGGL
ncbi:MAG: hypothetical protein KJN63_03960 [Acidimicrobiia bacterium]|nr:hypothetical protein [Acidimicrobiia bacterium]